VRHLSSYVILCGLVVALGVLSPAAAAPADAAPADVAPLTSAASEADAAPTQAETVTVAVADTATVSFTRPVEHVAAYWLGVENARVTLAFSSDGAHFSPPVDAGRDDAEGDAQGGMTYGGVLTAEGTTAVRITTDTPLAQLNVIGMNPGEAASSAPASLVEPSGATAAATVTAAVAAAVGQPEIISRAGWGANLAHLNWAPRFYPAEKVIVHHTADGAVTDGTQAGYARLIRSIYYYHAVTRDWGDIAYNFLIDPLGNIYEGRYSDGDPGTPMGEDAYGNGVTGGHTYNYNTGTVGIAVLGTYNTVDISAAARASLEELLAYVAKRHGIDPLGFGPYSSAFNTSSTVQTWNITGHRDYGSTDCPGDAFYNSLPTIRQAVSGLTGPVAAPTPSPTYLRLTMTPSAPVVGQQVTVSATLMDESSRTPVSGRTVSFATGGIATAQTSVGTANTDASGVASITMAFTAAGMRWVTADFDPGTTTTHRGSTTSAGFDIALSGLSATTSNTKVHLSWDAAPGVSGYNVYRNGVKINPAPFSPASYLDTGLANGMAYSYQVTAIVSGRESARSPAVSVTPGGAYFLDVSASHPYYQAIQSLAAAGVINGKADGKFYPDDLVTRQQFAKMIVLGCEYPVAESDVCLFKDVTKSGAASLYPDNYVAVCAAHEITVGKTSTTFDPYTNITRAQVATMVVRAAQDSKPSALAQPPTGWDGVLPASDKTHGANIARAEYSGLFSGIDLSSFSVYGKATRGEIAQIIWNLREK